MLLIIEALEYGSLLPVYSRDTAMPMSALQ